MAAGAWRLGHLAQRCELCGGWGGVRVVVVGGQDRSSGLGHKLMKVSNLDTPVN